MGDLLIRDIPDDLKQNLVDAARRSGRSLSDEVKGRLRRSVAESDVRNQQPATKAGEALRRLFADIPTEEREEFSKIMDEIEVERKKDFGRPFSFDE